MLRRVSLLASVLSPVLALTSAGCDKPAEEPVTVAPEPEPEPEPEPPKPSNEPSQTWEPLWATASGKPTGNLVGVRDGWVYALVGEFADLGTPSTHLVAFVEDTGAIKWTYAGKVMVSATGASEVWVALLAEETPVYVATKNGKKAKPKKGETDAITPFATPAAADGCVADGVNLTCGEWTVAEAGNISALTSFESQVCYAVAGAREVRCRAMSNGDLGFAIPVPPVEEVKEPDAANFQFLFANGKLFISNYDGSVLAFGPAGGGASEEPATDEPAAEVEG